MALAITEWPLRLRAQPADQPRRWQLQASASGIANAVAEQRYDYSPGPPQLGPSTFSRSLQHRRLGGPSSLQPALRHPGVTARPAAADLRQQRAGLDRSALHGRQHGQLGRLARPGAAARERRHDRPRAEPRGRAVDDQPAGPVEVLVGARRAGAVGGRRLRGRADQPAAAVAGRADRRAIAAGDLSRRVPAQRRAHRGRPAVAAPQRDAQPDRGGVPRPGGLRGAAPARPRSGCAASSPTPATSCGPR